MDFPPKGIVHMRLQYVLAAGLFLSFASPAVARPDYEGCKDHPLFTRMPNFYISDCENKQFEVKRFPTGPANQKTPDDEPTPKHLELEGPYTYLRFDLKEGAQPASGTQIMRNFENATKKSGGTVTGTYPGWCKAVVDESLARGNNCIGFGVAMKFERDGKIAYAFSEADDDGTAYELHVIEPAPMTQDIAANELFDKISKDGFIAVYLNFDTAKATLRQDSQPQVDQIVQMLRQNAGLKLEVAGHTDNQGDAKSNQKLSEARAKTVMAALVAKGIKADRLVAKGHGATMPIADNRLDDGRAKNRRVELVKR